MKPLIPTLLVLALIGSVTAAGCDKLKEAANTAKNTVTSMVDKVNTFEKDEDANALDNAVSNFVKGISDGTINKTTKGYLVTADLPSEDASAEERRSALSRLTLVSVLEEQGIQSRYPEDAISDFVYCGGKIQYKDSADTREFTPVTLSYDTTLDTFAK